jgi:hypothetical protein
MGLGLNLSFGPSRNGSWGDVHNRGSWRMGHNITFPTKSYLFLKVVELVKIFPMLPVSIIR